MASAQVSTYFPAIETEASRNKENQQKHVNDMHEERNTNDISLDQKDHQKDEERAQDVQRLELKEVKRERRIQISN